MVYFNENSDVKKCQTEDPTASQTLIQCQKHCEVYKILRNEYSNHINQAREVKLIKIFRGHKPTTTDILQDGHQIAGYHMCCHYKYITKVIVYTNWITDAFSDIVCIW